MPTAMVLSAACSRFAAAGLNANGDPPAGPGSGTRRPPYSTPECPIPQHYRTRNMSLAVMGLGTALPDHVIAQPRAGEVARRICCKTDEQAEVLPSLYRQSGIETRHLAIGAEVMDDVLAGTKHTQSVFLPTGREDDWGPSTEARMQFYRREALPLAAAASQRALAAAAIPAEAITHIVTVSCTGFSAPGLDYGLIQQLGLSRTVQRTNVGFMGCHGAVNGLRVAQAYTDSVPAARVLLCAVELCSIH